MSKAETVIFTGEISTKPDSISKSHRLSRHTRLFVTRFGTTAGSRWSKLLLLVCTVEASSSVLLGKQNDQPYKCHTCNSTSHQRLKFPLGFSIFSHLMPLEATATSRKWYFHFKCNPLLFKQL